MNFTATAQMWTRTLFDNGANGKWSVDE